MPELPIGHSPEALELATLRKTVAELTQKSATRKARITELETNTATLTAKATEAEMRIKALTIDVPLDELCSDISVAPQALRSALEADFKIELDNNGTLTLLNRSDSKPVVDKNGKPLPLESDAIRNLLLETKDEAKLKLYRAIVVKSKASGAAQSSSSVHTAAPVARAQFGLGIKVQ
jgi:hypothetical protein